VIAAQAQSENRQSLSMFFVGDDDEAKQFVRALIRDVGFTPVDAGQLANARLLEPFGLLMGKLGFQYDPLVAYQFLKDRAI
jgi:predicted dinucleotide-binding enzyme